MADRHTVKGPPKKCHTPGCGRTAELHANNIGYLGFLCEACWRQLGGDTANYDLYVSEPVSYPVAKVLCSEKHCVIPVEYFNRSNPLVGLCRKCYDALPWPVKPSYVEGLHDATTFKKWHAEYTISAVGSRRPTPTQSVKADTDKPRWSLVPWVGMQAVVSVLEFGARKYAPDNWRKVPDAKQRYKDALMRHVVAYAMGEDTDKESGQPHLAHAVCCALFLLDGGFDAP